MKEDNKMLDRFNIWNIADLHHSKTNLTGSYDPNVGDYVICDSGTFQVTGYDIISNDYILSKETVGVTGGAAIPATLTDGIMSLGDFTIRSSQCSRVRITTVKNGYTVNMVKNHLKVVKETNLLKVPDFTPTVDMDVGDVFVVTAIGLGGETLQNTSFKINEMIASSLALVTPESLTLLSKYIDKIDPSKIVCPKSTSVEDMFSGVHVTFSDGSSTIVDVDNDSITIMGMDSIICGIPREIHDIELCVLYNMEGMFISNNYSVSTIPDNSLSSNGLFLNLTQDRFGDWTIVGHVIPEDKGEPVDVTQYLRYTGPRLDGSKIGEKQDVEISIEPNMTVDGLDNPMHMKGNFTISEQGGVNKWTFTTSNRSYITPDILSYPDGRWNFLMDTGYEKHWWDNMCHSTIPTTDDTSPKPVPTHIRLHLDNTYIDLPKHAVTDLIFGMGDVSKSIKCCFIEKIGDNIKFLSVFYITIPR